MILLTRIRQSPVFQTVPSVIAVDNVVLMGLIFVLMKPAAHRIALSGIAMELAELTVLTLVAKLFLSGSPFNPGIIC